MEDFNFFSWLKGEESKTYTFARINDQNTPAQEPSVTLTPDEFYFRIDLMSMHIPNVREWLKTYHAVAYSFIKVPHMTDGMVDFNVVTSPNDLSKIDEKNADRIITSEIPLLGNVPFLGHQCQIKIGLFAVETSNLATNVIGLLTEMSKTAGVSYIASALPYGQFLTKGLDILTNSDSKSKLQIGLETTLSVVQTGYYIFIRKEKGTFNVDELSVSGQDFVLLDKNNVPVKEPYLIYRISAAKSREDWFLIPEIQKKYKNLQDKIAGRKKDEIRTALEDFMLTVQFSPDLLAPDAETIAEKVKEKTERFLVNKRAVAGDHKADTIGELKDIVSFN